MVLGVVLGAVGGAFFIGTAGSKVFATLTATVHTTPADITDDLDEGTYVVYELTGATRGTGTFNTSKYSAVTITPGDVVVLGPSGAALATEQLTVTETVDRNNSTFTGAVRFTVTDPGVHRIQVDGAGKQIIVGPSVVGSFGSAVAWLALVGLGALVGFIGVVLLIVGLVRGPRPATPAVAQGRTAAPPVDQWAAAPAATAVATPAGWYTDPRGEASLRWWDGRQWTENVS